MSEEPAAGSIAELTAMEQLSNMVLLIREQVSMLASMLEHYGGDSNLEETYEEMRLNKHKGEEMKIMLMEYLVRNSEVMMYSRSYIEMVRVADRFIQHADSVAYRLLVAYKNNVKINSHLLETLRSMIQDIRQQVELARSAFAKLPSYPRKAIEDVEGILKLEEDVDRIFRESIFKVYEEYSSSVSGLMVLKDLIEYVEELSDLLKYLGEEIRYLALVKTALK
ncbi:MAG: DUF47 domain-containing protein [Desulfurococcus sp.]|nr:DUF47 domain-containing protein [Desulfurococcus sp.]